MINERPEYDQVIQDITDYVLNKQIHSEEAYQTAHYCFLDTLACALMALQFPACTKLLGPIVPGADCQNGARVPGTAFQLDPVQAAFNYGAMLRWLDFNDTWLAAEWGHPSDNLGGILMCADYLCRRGTLVTYHQVLTAMIKAHEIQGVLALENSFNRVGLDHVVLVKVATTAVVTALMGGNAAQVNAAISLAWVDGQSLRTYRHAPNTGSRKSWAAGDATSRAVRLALMALKNEMGYPSALTTPTWGFYDVNFKGKPFIFKQSYDTYVMENILFKIAFPAEFHAQTAVEAAIALHPEVCNQLDEIDHIEIRTQEAAMRIISKKGPLHNPADRDHCLEYMIAIGLIFGTLTAEHYEDQIAQDPRIDQLREKMIAREDKTFSQDYLDPNKRAISNAIKIYFKDGQSTEEVLVEYPIGHRRRRAEGMPLLLEKFERSLSAHYGPEQAEAIKAKLSDKANLMTTPVSDLISLLVTENAPHFV